MWHILEVYFVFCPAKGTPAGEPARGIVDCTGAHWPRVGSMSRGVLLLGLCVVCSSVPCQTRIMFIYFKYEGWLLSVCPGVRECREKYPDHG